MKTKTVFNITTGIMVELIYALSIMLAAFLICLVISFKI